ncbi:HlyD family efflux transporter periplasmic adaptor subunit [Gluconacetobacter takamatsuzukensis]|uniref:HlyD family efflux transporter periplasmic adaptor subunit n=1 Tax=Gluconacetobacter takamatsuzukensis TaxID=1286190 RepID=A0A7W4PSD3_9PROT|nr:HlyD family efflux transporter periplasmic adaptor subunit [Gluconacetobacter takamatsuzukensis]MBB2206304.1 HlyD family efflux transporter periplasmic adaptor subunit [Gluconacetobacter takamatsuzukensis]
MAFVLSADGGGASPAAPSVPPPAWPPLRDDLELLRGPVFAGAPTWTLYDPARHRYIRLGWVEMEILQRWHMADVQAIIADIALTTTLRPTVQDVNDMLLFARQAELVAPGQRGDSLRLAQRARRPGALTWLLHHYLFFRIRLCNPDRLLAWATPHLRWIFTRGFCVGAGLFALTGLMLIAQQWATFAQGFARLMTPEGAFGIACALVLSKILHECGHGIAARHFGCRVPSMGVAFLVLWPVLWTDTTDAWRLTRTRDRLVIDCAGMVAETLLAACASIVWSVLPDGPLRDGAFTLGSSTWILTLSVNLSPLMRFDGYYILSDLLGVPNLQERAFAWTRWRTRRLLFGGDAPPPEAFSRKQGGLLLGYSVATWFYRFFLFTGIALVVYHAVFRALGAVLMGIELWVFLARPILREAVEWVRQIRSNHRHWRAQGTALAVMAVLILLLVPWRTHLHAPAILRAAEQAELYTDDAGVVTAPPVDGMEMTRGQVVAILRSPGLEHDVAVGQARLVSLNASLAGRDFDPTQTSALNDTIDQIAQQTAELDHLQASMRLLTVHAPFSGRLVDVPPDIRAGDTLRRHERIGTLVTDTRAVIEVYVDEADIDGLHIGARAWFQAPGADGGVTDARVRSISPASIGHLDSPEAASVYGGHIQARKDDNGQLVPDGAVYRVILEPEQGGGSIPPRQPGIAVIQSRPMSLLARVYRRTVALLMGEAGF